MLVNRTRQFTPIVKSDVVSVNPIDARMPAALRDHNRVNPPFSEYAFANPSTIDRAPENPSDAPQPVKLR